MRLFGGRADPQQFFCAFCLLSVYQLLADICHAPIQIPAIAAQNHDVGEFFSGAFRMGDLVSIAGFAVLLIASTAWIAVEIVFVLSLFRAFHISEQLGVTRTAISFVVGIGAWILSVLVLSQPLEANLYAAFRGR
jgi:hypothetical protein